MLVQLHGFCDSSELAYCAVIYIRKQTSSGVNVMLVTSKTKVAPLKKLSIPRLELLSCLLLSELVASVSTSLREIFNEMSITCWNDNASAIGWIKGVSKEWKQWEQNRVTKIRESVDPKNWRHVPGSDNPADIWYM